ncbi:MAG TPA: hypothetical protein P5026_04065 [Kiritimatiellia bacterium]|nr:hypothetical protein [Kiritimatiellia bacterium]HRU69707.1 hypothetical protein [Kiritimatiellia bacterium]
MISRTSVTLGGWLCCAALLAREPQWIFNNGPDVRLMSVGQGQLCAEVGLTKLTPSGSDLTVTVPMAAADAFPAAERPFFAVRYKYRTPVKQGGLFFTTDTLAELSDKSYSQFPVIGDNTWRAAIIDMRTFRHQAWKGTITSFRFDPINPSTTDSVCEISRFGFFPSQEAAQAFLDAAVDAADYSQPARFLEPMQQVRIPGGCLYDGYDRNDFLLRSTSVEKPSETTVVRFKPKAGAGDERVIPLCDTNRRGYTRFVARLPGNYRLAEGDVALDDLAGVEEPVRSAIRFVVARQVLAASDARAFRPTAAVSEDEWARALARLRDYGIEPTSSARPGSRAEAAVLLQAAIKQALGTAIDSPYTRAHLTRDRIRIGAWVNLSADAITDDFVATYRSAGFDWLIAHGALAGSDRREWLLRECDRYGVELILGDGAYRHAAVATADYDDHPSFAGTYIADEPGTDQYPELAQICQTYTRETDGQLPYINLLPMYANAAQLKYGAHAAAIEYYDPDPALYKKYCDSFCQMFDVPYICTDIYPLNWSKGRRTTYKEYCESINVIARSAREHGKDFWCFIQTFAWTPSKRTPTEAEFRWQSYCMLSFGCKGLLCWTYAGYKPEFPSLVTMQGQRQNAWYDAATVFKEIALISDAFTRYRNLGAMSHSCTDVTPYLRFSQPLERFPVIEQIVCGHPLLIGCFAAQEGGDSAFTVVNMSELEALQTVHVSLRLRGSRVVAWPRGQRVEWKLDGDGRIPLTLAPGEGMFVEVLR